MHTQIIRRVAITFSVCFYLAAPVSSAKEIGDDEHPNFCQSLLTGLSVAGRDLSTVVSGRGDAKYLIHHFELRRNAANAVARAIFSNIIPKVSNPHTRSMLEELANEIWATPQSGNALTKIP